MAEENIYNNYSFTDIQRYLSGSMTPAEMHDIEKAALEDIFLADAIEGYRNTDADTALKHLSQIEAVLHGDPGDAKIISISRNKNRFRRTAFMAAAVTLFTVTGIYLFTRTEGTGKSIVAQTKTDTEHKAVQNKTHNTELPAITQQNTSANVPAPDTSVQQIEKPGKPDAITTFASAPAASQVNYPDIFTEKEKQQPAGINDIAMSSAEAAAKTIDDNVKPVDNLNAKTETSLSKPYANGKKFIASNGNAVTINGRVFDNTGKAVTNAMINISGTNNTAVTDSKGKFSIAAGDSVSLATVTAFGYDPQPVALSASDKNIFFIKQNKSVLDDVAVTAVGKKKDAEGVQVLAEKKNATPVGGWDVYEGYVQGRLTTLQDTVNTDVHIYGDEVELEFAIDENGNPYDISILTPSDPELDKKAIDVVSQGPRWIRRSKSKKTHLKIKF